VGGAETAWEWLRIVRELEAPADQHDDPLAHVDQLARFVSGVGPPGDPAGEEPTYGLAPAVASGVGQTGMRRPLESLVH